MTATREHDLAAQLRHVVCQIGDNLIHAAKRYHQVTIAGHIKRRHCHLRAGERGQQFPISIDVAVPVQAAAKSGALELTDVEIDVLCAKPCRQGGGTRDGSEKAASSRYHPDRTGDWRATWRVS